MERYAGLFGGGKEFDGRQTRCRRHRRFDTRGKLGSQRVRMSRLIEEISAAVSWSALAAGSPGRRIQPSVRALYADDAGQRAERRRDGLALHLDLALGLAVLERRADGLESPESGLVDVDLVVAVVRIAEPVADGGDRHSIGAILALAHDFGLLEIVVLLAVGGGDARHMVVAREAGDGRGRHIRRQTDRSRRSPRRRTAWPSSAAAR